MKKGSKLFLLFIMICSLFACDSKSEIPAKFPLLGEWYGVDGNVMIFTDTHVEIKNDSWDKLLQLDYTYKEEENIVEIEYKDEIISFETKTDDNIHYLKTNLTEEKWELAIDFEVPIFVKKEYTSCLKEKFDEYIHKNFKELKLGDTINYVHAECGNATFTFESIDKYKKLEDTFEYQLNFNSSCGGEHGLGNHRFAQSYINAFDNFTSASYGYSFAYEKTVEHYTQSFELSDQNKTDNIIYFIINFEDDNQDYYIDLSKYYN